MKSLTTSQVIAQVNSWTTHGFDGCLASHQDKAVAINRHSGKAQDLPVAGSMVFAENYREDLNWDANPNEVARMVRASDEVYFIATSCQDGGKDESLTGFRRNPQNPQQWVPFEEWYD